MACISLSSLLFSDVGWTYIQAGVSKRGVDDGNLKDRNLGVNQYFRITKLMPNIKVQLYFPYHLFPVLFQLY